MKKISKFLILIVFALLFVENVYAEEVCGVNSSFNNPAGFVESRNSTWSFTSKAYSRNAPKNELEYDISYLTVKNNKFYVLGWAYAPGKNQDLGGMATRDPSDNTEVHFAFVPKDKSDDKEAWKMLEVKYASPSNGNCSFSGCGSLESPKFYDLSYWDCIRTQKSASIPNTCIYEKSNYTYGGFSAFIDLDDLDSDTEYKLMMNISGAPVNQELAANWIDVTASDAAVNQEEVKAFNDNKDGIQSLLSKHVQVGEFSDTARVTVDSGRLVGSTGFYCNSIASSYTFNNGKNRYRPESTYFMDETEYYFTTSELGKNISACRGATPSNYDHYIHRVDQNMNGAYYTCSSQDGGWGPGSIRLYAVQVADGLASVQRKYENGSNMSTYYRNVKPSTSGTSGVTTYVPAVWIVYPGEITVSTKEGEDLKSDVCEGKDIYNFYYMFLSSVDDTTDGTQGIEYSAKNNSDYSILSSLKDKNGNPIISNNQLLTAYENNGKKGYEMLVDNVDTNIYKMNVKEFYDHLKAARASSTGYQQTSALDFYIEGIPTISSNIGKTDNLSNWQNRTVQVDKLGDEWGLLVHDHTKEQGLGYNFKVDKQFKASPSGRKQMMNKDQRAATGKDNQLSPAVYRVSFCINDEDKPPSCTDDVTSAVCLSNDQGTKVVFHENNDLKTCTIPKNTSSGFTIIEKSETNEYCEVACKEDLDIELPGAKETAAGQYFKLDNYVPKITAKRTCVTSQIKKYSEIDKELTAMETELIRLYNTWQDWIAINGNQYRSDYYSGLSTITDPDGIAGSGICEERVPNPPDPITGKSTGFHYEPSGGTWTEYKWSINSSTGPNKASGVGGGVLYGGNDGTYIVVEGDPGDTCSETPNRSKQTYGSDITTPMINAETAYRTALTNYRNKINDYNKCFSWTDNTISYSFSGSDYRVSVNMATTERESTYDYTFEPKVTFDYPDKDGSVFPAPYTYNYTTDVNKTGVNTKNTYWKEGSTVNDQYNSGGVTTVGLQARGENLENRKVLSCSGTRCTTSSTYPGQTYFYSSAYIKREQEIVYEYHLPTLYTSVPSGRVSKSSSGGTYLQLEDEAVPVNINTLGGTYQYKLTIGNLKDKLRENKATKNPDDNWDKRFAGKVTGKRGALNAGDDYVCRYTVVNDIYLPDQENFNFFYRTVDPYEINPLGRTLGYNWSDSKADTVRKRMVEGEEDYTVLTNSADRDKFVFTLTPVNMAEIRRYNARRSNVGDDGYSDWDLNCSDYGSGGYHCYSNFLTCLASAGDTNESGQPGCSSVFGQSLSDYRSVSNYDWTMLDQNRRLLISKQNSLDGRG